MTPRAGHRPLLALLASAALLLVGCTGSDDPTSREPMAVPVSRAVVPEGWPVQRAPGFTVAVLPSGLRVRMSSGWLPEPPWRWGWSTPVGP